MGLAACGGAAEEPAASNTLDAGRAVALGPVKPVPPPPPPAPDATLTLVSASASGLAGTGAACAVSADGGKVLFSSNTATLVSGDTNSRADLFLKDLNGNGITRVVTTTSNDPIVCLGMTPDAKAIAFSTIVTTGGPFEPGTREPAIFVKNLVSGQQTRVTPLLANLPGVGDFQFAGLSDDGLRVAFVVQPTSSCSGYDCTANGPVRTFLFDLASGQLSNLDNRVRFTTSQGVADGDAWLSPNGRSLAFSSSANYPEAGDTTSKSDVYALDIASGQVRLLNTDASGRQITILGTVRPTYGVQAFLAGGTQIAFRIPNDTDAGTAGVYVKDLNSGALTRVLGPNVTYAIGNRLALSFSDDGRKVAYVESIGNTLTGGSFARVQNLLTGAVMNAAVLANGTAGDGRTTTVALLSGDGRAAVFSNNATNLVAGASTAELRVYRKLLP